MRYLTTIRDYLSGSISRNQSIIKISLFVLSISTKISRLSHASATPDAFSEQQSSLFSTISLHFLQSCLTPLQSDLLPLRI